MNEPPAHCPIKAKIPCVGLIGTNGVEPTSNYARIIEEELRHRLGEKHAPHLLTLTLQTPDFAADRGRIDWRRLGDVLVQTTNLLGGLGAESVLLCSSLLDVAADRCAIKLPVLRVIDPITAALRRANIKRFGLIGTRFADEERHWREGIARAGCGDVFLPVLRDQQHVATLLASELERGIVTEDAKADVLRIVYSLRQAGARAVVVCAPELTAILQDAVPIFPIYDAVELHALAAVDFMLAGVNPPTCFEPKKPLV